MTRGRKKKIIIENEKSSELQIPNENCGNELKIDECEQIIIPESDNNHGLPNKEFFRIDEVARYFDVTERCIRLWIQHGHLRHEKINGISRVTRRSILECRFRKN